MTEFFDVVLGQRAYRALRPDPVPDDLVTKVLEAAIHAPSAENHQPWEFVVVRDPATDAPATMSRHPAAKFRFTRTAAVRAALPLVVSLLLATAVFVKMSVAVWIAVRLYDSRLLSDRTLVAGAAGWLVAVLALYGVLLWLVATPFVARYFLLLVAILQIPLARLSAAPLALAWNRHR